MTIFSEKLTSLSSEDLVKFNVYIVSHETSLKQDFIMSRDNSTQKIRSNFFSNEKKS